MKWIKIFLLITTAGAVFFIGGCKKTKSGSFQLNIQAKYGTQYFALDTFDIDPAQRYLEVETLQFFLSHLYLVKSGGSLIKLTDVAFFDLNNPSTYSLTVPNIEGDFTGLTFYCGVDSVMDTISPSSTNTSASAPLLLGAASGMHWPMLYYLFEQTGGVWDTAWLPIMRNGFTYMVGGYTSFYEPVTLNSTFSVCCGSTTIKTLTLDYARVFYNSNNQQILNIQTQGFTQSDATGQPGEIADAQLFSNNWAQAFSLQ